MRINTVILLGSSIFTTVLQLAHVEALLLLPRNQGIRQRLKEQVQEYSRVHFNHSDPYSEEGDLADSHPDVIAARRPIIAIEILLTNGRHQAALVNYRQACSEGNKQEMWRIEQIIAAIDSLQPDRRTAEPLHAVG